MDTSNISSKSRNKLNPNVIKHIEGILNQFADKIMIEK